MPLLSSTRSAHHVRRPCPAAIVATATAPPDPPAAPIPPQLAAKPRGNPNLHLAARCGARTHAGCPCQAPAIRGRLRCRLHGGRSTGPRTPEGLARIRDARTIHGDHGAWARAKNRYRITLVRRTRVSVAVDRYQDFLHPAFVARLSDYPPKGLSPNNGFSRLVVLKRSCSSSPHENRRVGC
jgi:hypothetical protein